MAALALLAFALVSCASLFGRKWSRFHSAPGKFSVDFPAGTVSTIPTRGNELYRLTEGSLIFAASSFQADSDRPTEEEIDQAFSAFPVGFAKSVGGKITNVSPAVELNMRGVSALVKTANGACDLRLYNQSRMFYFLTVCYPDGEKDRDRFAHFFESLLIH